MKQTTSEGPKPCSFDQSPVDEELVDLSFGKRLKILVADDSPASRTFIEILLIDAGHDVTSVEGGQELVDRVSTSITSHKLEFDLVITDVQMPGMDGITATKHIRAAELEHRVPRGNRIIMLSAHVFPEEKRLMLAAGADYVVSKPIDFKELADVMGRLVTDTEPSPRSDLGDPRPRGENAEDS